MFMYKYMERKRQREFEQKSNSEYKTYGNDYF